MDKRSDMIAGASCAFDAEGFRGIGVDRVLAASGASTRTLYKHFGSRDGLVVAVLEARHRTFMERLEAEAQDADPAGSLFATLRRRLEERRARSCMLLRARSEYAAASEAIVTLVRRQKDAFRVDVSRLGCGRCRIRRHRPSCRCLRCHLGHFRKGVRANHHGHWVTLLIFGANIEGRRHDFHVRVTGLRELTLDLLPKVHRRQRVGRFHSFAILNNRTSVNRRSLSGNRRANTCKQGKRQRCD